MGVGLNSQGRWDAKGQKSKGKKSKLKVETTEKVGELVRLQMLGIAWPRTGVMKFFVL